ncbi:MAG TPA: hypothetical protein VMV14_05500 [Acidimicrobiales bacterium]|nr:hypothetical protein [Acidimicrobiales bacterium]
MSGTEAHVVFVEIFRLLLVIAGVVGGFQLGQHVGAPSTGPLVAAVLGALVAYVVGGVGGRLIDRWLRGAMTQLRSVPPAEVFAGSVVGTTGLLLGLAAGLGLVTVVRSNISTPIAAAVAWVLCAAGVRLGVTKGHEIARSAGLGHLLERPGAAPAPTALLVDTSALLERQLVVLGRAGLLAGGIVVPRFVLDEARAVASGPDDTSSRRARGGLEGLEALRSAGTPVQILEDEVPEEPALSDKMLCLARRCGLRLATCSAELARQAADSGLATVNLRLLTGQLQPQHVAGERLQIELVKEGSQSRQAVGYLADGDMVVVNDAVDLVGREVTVVVAATRATSQGQLVFAELAGPVPAVLSSR